MQTTKQPDRTCEDVTEILKLAKLNSDDLLPVSQSLYFTLDNFEEKDYRFLELDSHLQDALREGESLFIMGADDKNVVICTDSCTYDVTETETSNSLLLVENLKFSEGLKNHPDKEISKVQVSKIFYDYLEVTISKPHLSELNAILAKTIYKGPEYESEINADDLVSLDDLINNVQASKQELKKALSKMHILTLNNKIRLLDLQYNYRVLSLMLKLIEENSWEQDEVDYEETMATLGGNLVPTDVLNSMFDFYAEESKSIDGLPRYSYKEPEVCKLFAQVILSEATKCDLNDFFETWAEFVPTGMQTNEEMLYGIVIIDRKSNPKTIRLFREDNLPDTIVQRFEVLFQEKDKWTVPEIVPYIENLATEKLDVYALLAKHARASTVDGIKYYSAKHAK